MNIRYTLLLLLCLTACSKPHPKAPYVGATVTVVQDQRVGQIISNFPVNDGQGTTKWLVKFKEADPKPGKLYTTQAFLESEIRVQQ